MKRFAIIFALAFFMMGNACEKTVRQPAVAGAFYPADKAKLTSMVDGFLEQAQKQPGDGELVALVAPHAGYIYSGRTAGWAFKQVAGQKYDTVIVMGPSHRYPFQGASVWTGDVFRTPLGDVPVDRKLAASFLNEKARITFEPKAHEREHSVEVEVPFLQRALGEFRIVPIVVGDPAPETMEALSGSIMKALEDKSKRALLVISTDWAHYKDYDTTVRMDKLGIKTVSRLSSFEVMSKAQRGEIELCGLFPVMAVLDATNKLGADGVKLFKYENSGDVTGDSSQGVVGYAAMGIYRTGKASSGTLTKEQKDRLIKLAKETVNTFVTTGKPPEVKPDPSLDFSSGAFVTLKENGELRGCIGNFFSDGPICDTVSEMAVNACAHDYRFAPVIREELKDIKVEISVLSPLRKLRSIDDIKVGRDGLYVVKGRNAGVLLPQVSVEQGWDRDTFLAQTCRKAGLPPDAWKQGAEIYVFTAEVFGE